MSFKYAVLKKLVVAAGLKKRWLSATTEELLENLYGSDETLYACAPSFEAAMKKYGVDYRMIVGEGMFHCYPVFPIVKEAKEGWHLMVRLMKEEISNE